MATPRTLSKQSRWDQQRFHLKSARDRILSQYSFGKIKTWKDFLVKGLGHLEGTIEYAYATEQLASRISREEIISVLDGINTMISLREDNSNNIKTYETIPHVYESVTYPSLSTDKLEHIDTREPEKLEPVIPELVEDTNSLPSWWHISPQQKVTLLDTQEPAAIALVQKLIKEGKRAALLQAPTGEGKTYILAAFVKWILDEKYLDDKSVSPWPIVWITKASVVEQTKRVCKQQFGINVVSDLIVTNIDQLRSTFGKTFVEEKTTVEYGDIHIKFHWRPHIHPAIIIWDECQVVKNEGSTQSKIAQAYNDIKSTQHTWQIFSSATPFTRVSEAKCFAVATKVPYTFGGAVDSPLSNDHWPDFSRWIASPADPIEHSPAAIERFISYVYDYIVYTKGSRWQFHACNGIQMIDFENTKDMQTYLSAWDEYIIECAKQNKDSPEGKFNILVQFLKFRQKAELIRAPYIAKAMYEAVTYHNQAALAAVCFKDTIARIVCILHDDFNVPRHQISLIWGGIVTKKPKEKKKELTPAEIENIRMKLIFSGCSVDEIEDLIGDKGIDKPTKQSEYLSRADELDLGSQSKMKRQQEIDRFQSGRSLYGIYTFKSGGAGLSLHHTDDWSPTKVRRKKNGYAFLEDIPKIINSRQRFTILTPTYSAPELVQGMGRAPRRTSLSDTPQVVVFYRGTIEERVAYTVSIKLRCLKKVVQVRESWEDIIMGATKEELQTTRLITAPAQLNNAPPTTQFIEPTDDSDNEVIDVNGNDVEDEDETT